MPRRPPSDTHYSSRHGLEPPLVGQRTLEAHMASARVRVAMCLAVFCTFAMGGAIFGISSLYPSLYAQGFWSGLCDEAAECAGRSQKCCQRQLVRFSLVASSAFFLVDVASGAKLGHCWPTVVGINQQPKPGFIG